MLNAILAIDKEEVAVSEITKAIQGARQYRSADINRWLDKLINKGYVTKTGNSYRNSKILLIDLQAITNLQKKLISVRSYWLFI